MKKTLLFVVTALISVAVLAKEGGTLSSSQTPINPTETVVLTYDGTGTNFANWEPKCHVHAWLLAKDGETFSKDYGTSWVSCDGDGDYAALPDKVKMTLVSKGKYTLSMNIKEFFGVAEADLEKIDKLGIIVRAQYPGENNQTNDMFTKVVLPGDVKFYVTGNAALLSDAGVETAEWSSAAIASKKDTLTLKGLKAGVEYKLKVTVDGTWDTPKGFSDLTETAEGLKAVDGDDNNIGFTLRTAGDVQVIYTPTLYKLIGDFYYKTAEKKMVKMVPSAEWAVADAQFAAWIWGEDLDGRWTTFFTPVSSGNDTLQAEIITTADSIDFVRFSPKATAPSWENKDQQVWGEIKDTIDWKGLTFTIIGWGEGKWEAVERPCDDAGLQIDGVYKAGKRNVLQTEWKEYVLREVELAVGQNFKVYDNCKKAAVKIAGFAETSYDNFTASDGGYVVKEAGVYDFYLKIKATDSEIYVSKQGHFTQSVPSQCTDVMIQAFFNESYSDAAPGVGDDEYHLNLGNTKWVTLTPQAEELGHYFDLIWLPPSAYGSGMGYHPKQYSNQNSNWGTRTELETLISALHAAGSKVVADIVINHCEGWTSWCDFPEMDFGEYGKFYPDASYICQNDEVNAEWNKESAGTCWGKATGPFDDGENWDGARDWAHDAVKVQAMFKAYLQWMRTVMKYDGFRYDKGDGFNNWHHDNYNKAAGPYIAFMESWNGDDKIIWGIEQANRNLMALDFQTKWDAIGGIAGFDYSKCKGSGLLGRGYAHNAVTFIDSHDGFLRDFEFGGHGNSLTPALKDRLLQANAFLLSMPGVPCIFYPHWAKYKAEIKPMIDARKLAGVHSESPVYDEQVEQGGYQCTLQGKYGWLILQLGNKTKHEDQAWDPAYKLVAKGNGYAMWVNRTAPLPSGTEEASMPAIIRAEKFIQNGKLYIRMGERVYDAQGVLVK